MNDSVLYIETYLPLGTWFWKKLFPQADEAHRKSCPFQTLTNAFPRHQLHFNILNHPTSGHLHLQFLFWNESAHVIQVQHDYYNLSSIIHYNYSLKVHSDDSISIRT